MARAMHGFQHWGCNTHLTVAVYFRQPQMLWWIADRLGLALTSDQVQHTFDALVCRGVLRPKSKASGSWKPAVTTTPRQDLVPTCRRRVTHPAAAITSLSCRSSAWARCRSSREMR